MQHKVEIQHLCMVQIVADKYMFNEEHAQLDEIDSLQTLAFNGSRSHSEASDCFSNAHGKLFHGLQAFLRT